MTPASPAPPTCSMSNSSDRTAVIGIGNPLRKDDGIGIAVLDRLRKRDDGRFDYFDLGTSAIDLINRLSGYKRALIIDGINAGLRPGQLKIFGLKEIEAQNIKEDLSSTHQIDLGQLLALSKSLELKTEIIAAGIQVEDVSFGGGLSQRLAEKLESYADDIIKHLDHL